MRKNRTILTISVVVAVLAVVWLALHPHRPHNVILFVADGLRSGIVTPQDAPELAAVRDQGVDFQNSHSMYPTITTPNASAIATGHRVGDTGDFGNIMYAGAQPLPFPALSVLATVEDDAQIALLNARYNGDFLTEQSLLANARTHGFSTAAIGKLGPVAIQDVTQRDGTGTIVIDDSTGLPAPDGIPLAPDVAQAIKALGLPTTAPDRGLNSDPGAYNMPGVHVPNVDQQDWFAAVAADVVLPRFKAAHKPFLMVFWSRDPDGTQHNQGDSLNQVEPGINGPTTMAAIRNASNDLARLRAKLKALGLDKTTDIVVTADHGFSTASKQSTTSASTKFSYRDALPGFLPSNFLTIDLGQALNMPIASAGGIPVELQDGFHPKVGGLIGPDPAHPQIVVAPNGGSDMVYLTGPDPKAMAARVVALLVQEDYTGGIFVKDALGPIPGALPMSAVGLEGHARTPQPDMLVEFRNWAGRCAKPDTCQIEVADTDLQQGQGIHGSFGRGDTHNFMAAIGPDFKKGFVDPTPVSNADLNPTLARILGLDIAPQGHLRGRVIRESLKGGSVPAFHAKTLRSDPAPNGFVTQLNYQMVGNTPYFDAAGMPGRVLGLK
ncbi:MAG TPA: alkaline phosphatase family protein [Caulobacteraceae bacterium]|nr:alkaline phosphatase family protein [Caulobacteraceae bacterium]